MIGARLNRRTFLLAELPGRAASGVKYGGYLVSVLNGCAYQESA
jgi:hypothetical protein